MYLNIKDFQDIIKEEMTIWSKLPALLVEVQKKLSAYEEKQTGFIAGIERSGELSSEDKASIQESLINLARASADLREVLDIWATEETHLLGANNSTLQLVQLMLRNELITSKPEYNKTLKSLYGGAPVSELKKVILDLNDFFGGFFNNKLAAFLGTLDVIIYSLAEIIDEGSSEKLYSLYKELNQIHQEMLATNASIQKISWNIAKEIAELQKRAY